MARYVVNGNWPPQVAAALTPPILRSAVAGWWGWAGVRGAPGTQAVPVAKPGVHSVSPELYNQPSWCAPDVIYPSLYRSDPDIAWRHVPVRPQEELPVPATNLYNMSGVAMRARRTGGTHQVAQPMVVQRWPDLLGRLQPGGRRGGSGPLPPRGQ
jgi:hypothetical protein